MLKIICIILKLDQDLLLTVQTSFVYPLRWGFQVFITTEWRIDAELSWNVAYTWSVVMLARLRNLQSRQRWSEGTFSIIFVEISGHELRTVWRRSKLKNKIWHSGHNRHIALLKRTQKQVKIGCSVYIYKTTRIHSETILAVSPEI